MLCELPMDDGLQGFLGSFLGVLAAVGAIYYTYKSESRKEERETIALKLALGAEIRLFSQRCVNFLKTVGEALEKNNNIDLLAVKNSLNFPKPVVYLNIVNNLGQLGTKSHEIVYFYGEIELFPSKIDLLIQKYSKPNAVNPSELKKLLDPLVGCLEASCDILPVLTNDFDCDEGFISDTKILIKKYKDVK